MADDGSLGGREEGESQEDWKKRLKGRSSVRTRRKWYKKYFPTFLSGADKTADVSEKAFQKTKEIANINVGGLAKGASYATKKAAGKTFQKTKEIANIDVGKVAAAASKATWEKTKSVASYDIAPAMKKGAELAGKAAASAASAAGKAASATGKATWNATKKLASVDVGKLLPGERTKELAKAGAEKAKEQLSKNTQGFAVVLAIFAYVTDVYFGFSVNATTIVLDGIIAFILALLVSRDEGKLGGKYVLAMIVFVLLEITRTSIPFIGEYIVYFPWWAIFVLIFEGGGHYLVSTTPGFIFLFILLILISAPYYQEWSTGVTFEGKIKAQQISQGFKSWWSESWSEVGKAIQTSVTEYKCRLNPDNPECKALEEEKREQMFAAIKRVKELPTLVDIKISELSNIFSQEMSIYLSKATNRNEIPLTIAFSCEATGLKGIATPASVTIPANSQLSESDRYVKCKFNQTPKAKIAKVRFIVEIKDAVSSSSRNIYIMGEKIRNSMLREIEPGADSLSEDRRNTLILKVFPEIQQKEVNLKISDDPSVPIIRLGPETIRVEQGAPMKIAPFVFGIKEEGQTKIPLAIGAMNNRIGGNITKIKRVYFDNLNELKLDSANCGYNSQYLEPLKVTGVKNQFEHTFKSCSITRLLADLPNPNRPNLVSVNVDLTYDYKIIKSKDMGVSS